MHLRRYVPFYGTQLWADLATGHAIWELGERPSCKPNWTDAAQDELVAQFWADAPALLPTLGSKPHWMGLSEIEWMIHRGCGEEWGIPISCHPLAEHITFTTPEALTEPHPTVAWRSHFYGHEAAHNNSLPVPYVGHIHRVSIHNRDKLLADEGVASKKTLLASLSFASTRNSPLRVALAAQCQAAPEECWFMPFKSFAEVIDTYRHSWFCVQPHGDTPTRSALLDCLASGLAVPAVFDEYLADMLPFADVVDFRTILAYVPEEDIMGTGGSLLQSLKEYSNDTRMTMLENVQRVAHAFQYAVRALSAHRLSCWGWPSQHHASRWPTCGRPETTLSAMCPLISGCMRHLSRFCGVDGRCSQTIFWCASTPSTLCIRWTMRSPCPSRRCFGMRAGTHTRTIAATMRGTTRLRGMPGRLASVKPTVIRTAPSAGRQKSFVRFA